MPQFNSKFSTGDLVEYKQDRNDEGNLFGFVTQVSFFKSDAVNHAAVYTLQRLNTKEVDSAIAEQNIVRQFIDSGRSK